MGFCYENGKLVCESCGEADGTVRKHQCPQGWCQPSAICSTCWSDPVKRQEWKQWHIRADCAGASAKHRERKELEARLLAEGKFVRTSAITVKVDDDDITGNRDMVRVTFRGEPEPHEMVIIMPRDTYNSIPILQPATPEDFGY